MRIFATLFLLTLFLMISGQSLPAKKLTLAEALSAALKNNSRNTDSGRKSLLADVEIAYFKQVYQISRLKILHQEAELFHDIERIAQLRYESGDIDLLERSTMMNRILEIKTEISMLNDDITISGNRLRLLLITRDELVPADSSLILYAIHKDASFSKPDSVRLPADYERENLELELNKIFKKILYFQQVALVRADVLDKVSRIRFEKEEIDYTEFVQHADEAFRIRLEYLQTLNNYNQIAIQLELYAY
jgi:hypothetical protein